MKRYLLFLSVSAVLGVALAGCGAEVNESDALAGGESSVHVDEYVNQELPEIGTKEEEIGGEESDEGEVHALGKWCNVSCSVVRVGQGWCPANIGGSGRTSFLGGYNKACEKAQADAASKLPPHCRINTCSRF